MNDKMTVGMGDIDWEEFVVLGISILISCYQNVYANQSLYYGLQLICCIKPSFIKYTGNYRV